MARAPQIRRIGPEELEIVRELALIIWPKCYRNIIGPDRVDAMLAVLYATPALEAEMQAGHVFWIVRVGDLDVGYASAYVDGTRLWLRKLYVRDDFRGSGLGKQLMAAALDHFSASELALNVNKDNAPAISYYLRTGFEIESEVPVRMGPYDFTDYVMRKSLI